MGPHVYSFFRKYNVYSSCTKNSIQVSVRHLSTNIKITIFVAVAMFISSNEGQHEIKTEHNIWFDFKAETILKCPPNLFYCFQSTIMNMETLGKSEVIFKNFNVKSRV
jgi:hypothetical protein